MLLMMCVWSASAEVYDFANYASHQNLGSGESVSLTSSGITVSYDNTTCTVYNNLSGNSTNLAMSKFALQGNQSIRRSNGTTATYGLYNSGGGNRFFVIRNVKQGQKITVNFYDSNSEYHTNITTYGVSVTDGNSTVANGTNMVSGQTYLVNDNGNLVLSQARYGWIYSVNIEDADPFYFSKKSAFVENGTSNFNAQQNGISLQGTYSNVTYSKECYGNITDATVDANGISNIRYLDDADKGGAIVVHAKSDVRVATYVLTVAYKQNYWDFTAGTFNSTNEHGKPMNPDNILEDLKANNSDWALYYKVIKPEETYLNAPVICNATPVDGNNADYNKLTAGLLITADAKGFGSNTKLPSRFYNANSEILSESYTEALNYDVHSLASNAQSRAEILTLHQNSELTIPYLKKGDYVRVKWKCYDNDKGDKIELTNLTDLVGQDMNFIYASSIRNGRNGQGYHIFKVKSNGPVKFKVGDNGWVNIYSIKVVDPNETPKAGFTTFREDHPYNEIVTNYNNAMRSELKIPDNQPTEFVNGQVVDWDYDGSTICGQHNVSVEYYLEDLYGNPISTSSTLYGTEITIDGHLTLKGHGQCVVVSKGFTILTHIPKGGNAYQTDYAGYQRYYVDLARTLITVNETGMVQQSYPYTWDFTDLSADTKSKLSADVANWSHNNGVFTPTDAYQEAFVTGTAIGYVNSSNENKKIDEYKGFGIKTNVANGYSTDFQKISVTDDGLVVREETPTSSNPVFIIPKVSDEYRVYVRYSGNGSVTLTNGAGTVSEVNYSEGQIKVCNVQGNGSGTNAQDVTIKAGNVTIMAIGVTNMEKEGSFYSEFDKYYYNSECQSEDIDYGFTEDFTGVEMGAYLVLSTNASKNTVATTPMQIVPATIGSIIYSKDTDKHPIFVPSVNKKVTQRQKEDAESLSILRGVTTDTPLEGSNATTNRYVFTNIWFYVNGNDRIDENNQIASVPGFFRVNSSGTLKAHRAYLEEHVNSTTSPVKAYSLYPWNGDIVDAIDAVPTTDAGNSIDVNGTFYTLQGVKIEGMPKKGGIYIQNGKKIFVK